MADRGALTRVAALGALTRLAALGSLSRIAGEGGPSLQGWVGEGSALAGMH